MALDLRETASCTCTRLRRTARRVTALYDKWLGQAGVSVAQFTLLVMLSLRDGAAIGVIAAKLDLDPTTLNRNLKPLARRRLVRVAPSVEDGRVRTVSLTPQGRAKVEEALPLWQRAQEELKAACGADTAETLNGLLDHSYAKLKSPL